MPIRASEKKSLKKNHKQNQINRAKVKRIKTERKKFLSLITEGKTTEAQEAFKLVQSLIAKAAKTNLFHWKKSARLISRMANKFPKDA